MLMQSPNFRKSKSNHSNNESKKDKKKWGSNTLSKTNKNDNDGYQKIPNTDINTNSTNESEEISQYEISIMTGILKLSKVSISEIMIHMKDMYMLSDSIKLDDNILHAILRSGYSRIPIFKRKDKQHVKGYLLVKTLVVINPNDKVAIESLELREPLVVRPVLGLLEMLNMFREGECHLALVSKDPMKALKSIKDGERPMESAAIIGMVTLEDVIEKMIQYDIIDETDVTPNKYPNNACSSTLLYHNVGKSGKGLNIVDNNNTIISNTDSNINSHINTNRYTDLNQDTTSIIRVHSSGFLGMTSDTNPMNIDDDNNYYQLNK